MTTTANHSSAEIHTLDLDFCGLPHAIAAYLVVGPDGPVLVETGPASTLETLKLRLAEHGLAPGDIRHVLVTHIHLDHAGAAGWWARQGARVYVHHAGAAHLVDPTRLLVSAGRIYGDMMDTLWGETVAAPADRVTAVHDGDAIDVGGVVLVALDTPGHAGHHLVFRLGDVAFTGDVAGIRLMGTRHVAVPTPPPEFDLSLWLRTLDRLLDERFTALYPTHFGRVEDSPAHLATVRSLLGETTEFVRQRVDAGLARDEIVQEYVAWQRELALASGMPEDDLARIDAVIPGYMSVDGLSRYWRKSRE